MRGMVVGEKVVSQAQTKEFDDGYARTFGERKPQRGRWVMDPVSGKLVPIAEYRPEPRAIDAPIMSGRFYENTAATDGADIGSRAKHQAYMREHGLAMESDFRETRAKAQAERAAFLRGEQSEKPYREAVERAIHHLETQKRK